MDVDKQVDIGRVVDLQLQNLVRTVLQKCKLEKQNKKLMAYLSEPEERASFYTDYPKKELYKLEPNMLHKFKLDNQPFDVFERILILKELLRFYLQNKFPTYRDCFPRLQESLKVSNGADFRYKLTQMGFEYRKTTMGHIILAEDMKLSFQRFHYLNKIKKYRKEGACIYYLDERVINEGLKFGKPSLDVTSPTENSSNLLYGHGYYFYHVMSDQRLENYLFTNKKSKDTYLKWVFQIALKIMKPESLIVIDDHFLHGKLIDDTITRYHPKSDMVDYLRKNNIPFSETMRKPELYDIISKSIQSEPEYNFDKLIKAHGFEVLRLPFGCNNLSPLSFFWKEMTTQCRHNIIVEMSPEELEEKTVELITKLHISDWKKMTERVIHLEDQFLDIDASIETSLDQFCKFDTQNIGDSKIPEYFYVLENY